MKDNKTKSEGGSSTIIDDPNDISGKLDLSGLDDGTGDNNDPKLDDLKDDPKLDDELNENDPKLNDKEEGEGEGEEEGENGDQEDELTDEQVQAKLDELEKKDESDLTDEEVEFINNNTSTPLEEFYSILGEEEGIDISKYEDSFEGTANLSRDVAQKRSEKLAAQLYNDRINEQPALKLLEDHLREGKGLETFLLKHHATDYSTINMGDEDGQKQMISYYYKNIKGLDDAIVNSIVEKHENDGKLEDVSKLYKSEMDESRKATIKAREDEEAEKFRKQQEDDRNFSEEVKGIVRKGKIGELTLNSDESKKFEKQLFSKTKEGESLVDQAYNNFTTEEKLTLDYLILNKDKLSGLFAKGRKIKSDKKSLKDNWKQNRNRKGVKLSGEEQNLQDSSNLNLKSLNLKEIFTGQEN